MLLEHPAVAEAAAFGVPDTKYGEEVWAAVVLKGDSDAERLQAFCRAHLADFKVPKDIRPSEAERKYSPLGCSLLPAMLPRER